MRQEVLVPWPRIKPLTPQWKRGFLTPGPRGKSRCFGYWVLQILSDFCESHSVSLPSCIAHRLPGEDRHVNGYVCHQLGTPQSKQRCCFISAENELNLLRQAVWAVWPGSLLLSFLIGVWENVYLLIYLFLLMYSWFTLKCTAKWFSCIHAHTWPLRV